MYLGKKCLKHDIFSFIIIIFLYLFLYGLSFGYLDRIPRVIENSETMPFSPGTNHGVSGKTYTHFCSPYVFF